MLQTLLTALKQLLFALSCYGSKTHARAGIPAAPQQVCLWTWLPERHGIGGCNMMAQCLQQLSHCSAEDVKIANRCARWLACGTDACKAIAALGDQASTIARRVWAWQTRSLHWRRA